MTKNMDKADLEKLIERLEKAPHGSKSLDIDICAAVGDYSKEEFQIWCGRTGSRNIYEFLNKRLSARYTSSIDAAMTLVPEAFKWKAGYGKRVPHVAELRDYRDKPILGTFIGECDSNRAIALCIAAMKAIGATHD